MRIPVSFVAVAFPFAVSAQNAVDAAQLAASDAKVRVAVDFLDKAWAQTFRLARERYVPPRVVGYDDFVMTACGRISGMNAYACDLDGTISYSRSFLALLMAKTARATGTDGDMGAILPIAHEWGHSVQYMLKLDYSSAVDRVELDADCLAGAVIAQADAQGYLQSGDLAETEYALQLVADAPLVEGEWGKMIERINTEAPSGSIPTISNALGDHGNSRERVAAFHRGLKSDAHTCLLGIPRRAGR
jgi:predicted metalloprotease